MNSRRGLPDPHPVKAQARATTAPVNADDLRKVYVEPTNACNLTCSTCVRHAWDEPEGFMEWATFEAGVGGLAAGTVAFMGFEEPLLHPRFLDMVRLAKSRGPNYGPGMRIGIEFVAMRSNVGELPGLNRLAAQLGATFIIVSNALAYTSELQSETLYGHRATVGDGGETTAAAALAAARIRRDETLGAALGQALARSGPVDFTAGGANRVSSRCPFIESESCVVAWHGGVSPCPPPLHSYTCFVQGREKRMTRWEAGRLPGESLTAVWAKPAYAGFRERVRCFDFPPCTDCACDLLGGNEEDCFGNPRPVCGDCLWARGIVRCA